MKNLGILALLSIAILSGCSGGSTEQTRTTVSDQSILPNTSTNTRTPTSQTTTSDDSTPPKSVSDSNSESNETSTQTSDSGDAPPNSGFSISR